MSEENLSRKAIGFSNGLCWFKGKDVKEKIQNVQRRLKEFCQDHIEWGYINDEQCEIKEEIDKIFKEEIGEKFLK